jgi:hypothetical protein
MQNRAQAGDARRVLSTAGALGLGLAGCLSAGSSPATRDYARPAANAALDNAPALCPTVPVATTTANRGQSADIVPTAASASPTGHVAARVRASVNGIPILDDELREAMVQNAREIAQAPDAQRAAKQQEVTERELNRLIERELVLEEAFAKLKAINKQDVIKQLQREAEKEADRQIKTIKKGLEEQLGKKDDEEIKVILQQQGLSVDGLRRQSERSFMMWEYIRNLVYPKVQRISLPQVKEYYENHPNEFRVEDKVKWQDIFIDASQYPDVATARNVANQVLTQARAGADFAALAKQYDNGDSRLRNGDGLGQKRGEIVPAQAEAVVWALKQGEVGYFDMGFGLHIVRVAERQYTGLRPFNEACQTEVRKKLENKIAEGEYKQIVADLKRKASITIYP